MIFTNYLPYFLWNCLDILLIMRYMNRIYEKKKCKQGIKYIIAFCLVLFTTISMKPTPNYLNLMAITSMSFFLLFLYEDRVGKKFLFSFLLFVISAFWSAISYGIATCFPYGEDLAAMLLCYAGIGILLELVPYFRLKKHGQIPYKIWILLFSIPTVSAAAFFCIMTILQHNQTLKITIVSIVLLAILLFINLLVFFLFERFSSITEIRTEQELLKQQLIMQEKYYALIESNQQSMIRIRHDMKNQLQTAVYLLLEGKTKELKAHLEILTDGMEKIDKVVTTQNTAIDSILNMKITEMKKDNIVLHTEIAIPSHLKLTFEQAAVIFGNILDNAREACLLFPVEERYVNLKIVYRAGMLYIRLENPTRDRTQGDGLQLKTSKPDKKWHGYGMKNVSQVVQELHGNIDVVSKDGIFKIMIALYGQ